MIGKAALDPQMIEVRLDEVWYGVSHIVNQGQRVLRPAATTGL
jgi:hypothetical protein